VLNQCSQQTRATKPLKPTIAALTTLAPDTRNSRVNPGFANTPESRRKPLPRRNPPNALTRAATVLHLLPARSTHYSAILPAHHDRDKTLARLSRATHTLKRGWQQPTTRALRGFVELVHLPTKPSGSTGYPTPILKAASNTKDAPT
jgi:hypothetical protein